VFVTASAMNGAAAIMALAVLKPLRRRFTTKDVLSEDMLARDVSARAIVGK
jgi:hypothetical protein